MALEDDETARTARNRHLFSRNNRKDTYGRIGHVCGIYVSLDSCEKTTFEGMSMRLLKVSQGFLWVNLAIKQLDVHSDQF